MNVFKIFSACVSGVLLVLILLSLCSCSFWQVISTTVAIVEEYPEDNPIEQNLQDIARDEFDINVDLSFWDGDDEDKDWAGHTEDDPNCSCEK